MNAAIHVLLAGAGATAFIDAWAIARRRLFGTPLPNYAWVGRWVGWMARGKFAHDSIARASPIRGETAIGWSVHYGVGIAFAAVLPLAFGVAWLERPTFLPALGVGAVSVVAPYFVMQPAMGAGIAASRTSRPNAARAQSLVTHVLFGAGLYAAAALLRLE
jgi:hypothetical protein